MILAFVKCPYCDQRINLFDMKDFESYSKLEVQRHYRARHPKVPTNFMPYTPILFEFLHSGGSDDRPQDHADSGDPPDQMPHL